MSVSTPATVQMLKNIIDGTTPVANATTAEKVGSSTIGGKAKPVYVSSGTITECTSTVGGTAKPVYMNAGTITECTSTVGGTAKPVYMNAGTITECTSTVGSSSLPVYMNAGTITECSAAILNYYGTCSTAAATATKVVKCSGFTSASLVAGAKITVWFTYANTTASPILNVNSTGAYAVFQALTSSLGTPLPENTWLAGSAVEFLFTGSGWLQISVSVATSEGTYPKMDGYAATSGSSFKLNLEVAGGIYYGICAGRFTTSSTTQSVTMPLTFYGTGYYEVLVYAQYDSDYSTRRNVISKTSGSVFALVNGLSGYTYNYIAFGRTYPS